MNLHDYLKKHPRGELRRLASKIGAPTPDVCRWATGKRPIPLHRAMAIENATNGEVTRKDMFPNDWQKVWPELEKVKP